MKLGEQGSELKLARPGQVRISAKVAARLPAITDAAFSDRFLPNFRPGISYWHLERSRIPGTREVPVVHSTENLSLSVQWTEVTNSVAMGRTNMLTLNSSSGKMFFRLTR